MIKGGRIGIGTTTPEGGYFISGVQSGGQGIEIKYSGTVLPGPSAGSEEYIPLQLTYHQTNYHASSFPRYRFRLDSISGSTGLGNGCFSIEHSGSTSASFKAKLLITNTGQLLVNKETARFSPPTGVFCLQSTSGSNGYTNYGEMRNLTQSAGIITDNLFWTALRYFQISNTSSSGGHSAFALGIEATNNNNYKGQLTLNPYGGSVAVGYSNYVGTSRKLFVNGDVFAAGSYAGSDDRIKYNETPIGSAITIINKLNPYKYEKITSARNQKGIWIPSDASWNEVKNDVDLSGNRLYEYSEEIGFIAQDIRSEIPDLSFCVSGEEEDASGNQTLLAVNYNNIFCLAVQAVQELDAKRKEDNKKFIDLNKRLLILEEKLKNIESTDKEYIL